MPIHPVFTLMPICKHLKLFPKKDDLPHIKALIWELREEDDTTPEEAREYIDDILGLNRTWLDPRWFKAECTKLKHLLRAYRERGNE
ncbi:MAG: hypothetical protein PHF35_00790 [Candidatus Moranbacteria bacterium]|nr:hypothetical protein [Candidatus Moranbacteria bacterium]